MSLGKGKNGERKKREEEGKNILQEMKSFSPDREERGMFMIINIM